MTRPSGIANAVSKACSPSRNVTSRCVKPSTHKLAVAHGDTLLRGHGHVRVDSTPAGVSGLHDMGANA